MTTKLDELRSGCFHKAMDDEEMFVLLARDTTAPDMVEFWAWKREQEIATGKRPSSDMEQVNDARETAKQMRSWREANDGAWREGLFAPTIQIAQPAPDCRRIGTNTGHGHVWTRPDGSRARCGGERLCTQCMSDRALVDGCKELNRTSDVDLVQLSPEQLDHLRNLVVEPPSPPKMHVGQCLRRDGNPCTCDLTKENKCCNHFRRN